MENLILIKTVEGLEPLIRYINDNEYIAFDTETTGVHSEASIIGFSVSADETTGYYVVLSQWDKEQQKLIDLETKAASCEVLKLLVGKSLIMHNAPFDCMMVKSNYGIELMDSLHTDTMILAHLVDENRMVGLKELGVSMFGQSAKSEQAAMKQSVEANGGKLTKKDYEMYKADADLMGRYGAKDAILTIKLFYILTDKLIEQGLFDFFYKEESMPLLRGPTYQLNTTGIKVNIDRLNKLKADLEIENAELYQKIYEEITPFVIEKYPGTKKSNVFNIGSSKQIAWLVFEVLGSLFDHLTGEGRKVCTDTLGCKIPYNNKAKRDLIELLKSYNGHVYKPGALSSKTGRMTGESKIRDYWNYLACDAYTLKKLSKKYEWVGNLLKYNKNNKLLSTYITGVKDKLEYGVIRSSFLQHGTTSGRYSSRNINFQNLPRDDKRIKSCFVSRPGKVFVGEDYSQLEPRVFASVSQDEKLMDCFKSGDDFYSTIGISVFDKYDASPNKEADNAFAKKYPELRQISKVIALSATYGTTAGKMAPLLDKDIEEAKEIIENYFERFPKVKSFMLSCHAQAMNEGIVYSLYGRPRRMPDAKNFYAIYGKARHEELPYTARNLLNLSVNHRVQSTAASIVNRAMIAFYNRIREENIQDCQIVMQVHDEVIVECLEQDAERVKIILQECMANTTKLPGVALTGEAKIAKNLGDLK
jgi:DNA polymerase-1